MKRKTKKKIKAAAKNFMHTFLEIINDVAESMPQLFETKGQYQRRLLLSLHGHSLQKVQLGLHRLKQQGLIKERHKKRFVFDLTLAGRHKLLMQKISKTRIESKNNRSTIVIFDIPEEKTKHRTFLRRLLIKNGFINLQKSVLISRFELSQEFFTLLTELKIRQYVTIIKGQVQYR